MKFDFSSEAMKAIGNLDTNTAGRIIKGIIGLPEKGDIKRLQGDKEFFRLRIGSWRILYKHKKDEICIENIAPRGKVYK